MIHFWANDPSERDFQRNQAFRSSLIEIYQEHFYTIFFNTFHIETLKSISSPARKQIYFKDKKQARLRSINRSAENRRTMTLIKPFKNKANQIDEEKTMLQRHELD